MSDASAHVYETPVGAENFSLTNDKPGDGAVIALPNESRPNEYQIREVPGVQRSETAQYGNR